MVGDGTGIKKCPLVNHLKEVSIRNKHLTSEQKWRGPQDFTSECCRHNPHKNPYRMGSVRETVSTKTNGLLCTHIDISTYCCQSIENSLIGLYGRKSKQKLDSESHPK